MTKASGQTTRLAENKSAFEESMKSVIDTCVLQRREARKEEAAKSRARVPRAGVEAGPTQRRWWRWCTFGGLVAGRLKVGCHRSRDETRRGDTLRPKKEHKSQLLTRPLHRALPGTARNRLQSATVHSRFSGWLRKDRLKSDLFVGFCLLRRRSPLT
ncbi:unnamed protein product [Protopolystoma xenopodis]|uniref:Uncharacterized protein n=1 Tax=Protopolystoma xenopodis TaxID=117903 RepID=A0A3S5CIL4_9PLAT|nr:unnamed protein product [Protopolystoma xenopodis]